MGRLTFWDTWPGGLRGGLGEDDRGSQKEGEKPISNAKILCVEVDVSNEEQAIPDGVETVDADVTDELLCSPTSRETRGVKRRSSSCDGRVEGSNETELGSIFFHSTPVRPGAGLGVTFKGDMDLINEKIQDLEKKIQAKKTKTAKKKQEKDKRWTRGGATKRQPLKKAKEGNVEKVKESDEQEKDKRWTKGGATKRQPLKKAKEGNVEKVKESDEQILEEGIKADSAGVKDDDVSGRGDNVSVNIDARDGGLEDIMQEEDSPKGASIREEPGNSDNDDDGDHHLIIDEDIEERKTDGGEEDGAGNKIDSDDREKAAAEVLGEVQERQDGPKESQGSSSLVDMDKMEEYEHKKLDPFEFHDDSFEDPLYQPPKRRAPLPSSATKRPPPRKHSASGGGNRKEHVKKGTGPADVGEKRQKIDPKVLEFLVHRFAKAKRKDLATEVLPLSFFNELVRAYGAVPGGGRLAPYTSGTDTTRTFWDVGTDLLFCMRYVRCVHCMSCPELMI